jgi:hypothetical protein
MRRQQVGAVRWIGLIPRRELMDEAPPGSHERMPTRGIESASGGPFSANAMFAALAVEQCGCAASRVAREPKGKGDA